MRRSILLMTSVWALLALHSHLAAQPPEEEGLPNEEANPFSLLLEDKLWQASPGDDELKTLLKARYGAAVGEVNVLYQYWVIGNLASDRLHDAILNRLIPSRLALCATTAERVTVLERALQIARQVEDVAKRREEVGVGTRAELPLAQYQRIEIEIQLLRARQAAKSTQRP